MDKWEARERKVNKKRDRKQMNKGHQNPVQQKAPKPRVVENRKLSDLDLDEIFSLE